LDFFLFVFDTKWQKYYHARLMSAPAVIDSLEFARSEQKLSGSLSVVSLKRLDDLLADAEGDLHYELSGGHDDRHRPQLQVRISGRLHLQCQRCLGSLDYSVDVANSLLLMSRGTQLPEGLDDPEAPDMIEVDPELDVAALIEDEVLLSLPLAPRHPEGVCASRADDTQDDEGVEVHSAFGKLAALKRPRNKL
jgi:uncharacterized protein